MDVLRYTVLLVSILGTCHTQRQKQQTPKPLKIGDPVLYPEDYCAKFDEKKKFNYIVVGAGPAGGTVSRRLAEDKNVEVLVLEAGGDPDALTDVNMLPSTMVDSSKLWTIPTEKTDKQCVGFHGEVCTYTFGKFLGGSSVINAMMYLRGNHRDYDEWEEADCPGWGWRSMLPYFKKLENFVDPEKKLKKDNKYHSKDGPFTTSPSIEDPQIAPFQKKLIEALRKSKIPETRDHNGRKQTGFGEISASKLSNGFRDNSAKAYLLNIPDNMKVCKNAVVSKLQISKDKKVTGVEFTYNGDKKFVGAADEFIVSAGPISSPQILERSGLGRKDVLQAAGVEQLIDLEGVGENLHEHMGNVGCAFAIDLNSQTAANPLSISLTSTSIFLNITDFSKPVPDLQWIFISVPPKTYNAYRPEIAQQYDDIQKTRQVVVASPVVLRQSNPGYVHITGTDPTVPPKFQPNQFTSPYETHAHGEGCRLMRKIMEDPVLKPFKPSPVVLEECKKFKYNSDDEVMCHARLMSFPFYHIAGTTKMGPSSDKKSVVDVNLRVHGVKNLRVVDLGVMPQVPRSNTEIPTIAVAEKAADIIKKADRKENKPV